MKQGTIYRSLQKDVEGIYVTSKTTEQDKTIHILDVNGELKEVSDSVFKRWWRSIEGEQQQEQVAEQLEAEIVEESLVEQVVEQIGKEILHQVAEETQKVEIEVTAEPKKEPKPKTTQEKRNEIKNTFRQLVLQNGASANVYSEGREGVIKVDGISVMFFGFVGTGVRLYFKETPDFEHSYQVEEKHSYPSQFPFRVLIKELDEKGIEFIQKSIELFI